MCGGDGHTEALKVEFDPRVISYDDLLNAFWEEHNPSGYKPKAQYKSAIWPTSESQKEKALASRAAIEAKYGSVSHGHRGRAALVGRRGISPETKYF